VKTQAAAKIKRNATIQRGNHRFRLLILMQF
jgi:hypothetical protein